MVKEQDKTLQALQTAIQMEIDGKELYLKASEKSHNELGKKLLQSLAAEEDTHRQKFEEIYGAIRSRKDWPKRLNNSIQTPRITPSSFSLLIHLCKPEYDFISDLKVY